MGQLQVLPTCCLASWNAKFYLIFHFDNFLFDLPFRTTSHIRWVIAITIGTFCFDFTFMIVMSSLCTFCTFWFVLAESFVVAIFLINYNNVVDLEYKLSCYESGNQLWSEGVRLDYLWSICRNLKELTAHFSPLHTFNFGHTLWLQFIFDVIFIDVAQF